MVKAWMPRTVTIIQMLQLVKNSKLMAEMPMTSLSDDLDASPSGPRPRHRYPRG
jgi:hypothetical protein